MLIKSYLLNFKMWKVTNFLSITRCVECQKHSRKCYEELCQQVRDSEILLSQCASKKMTSHKDCKDQQLKLKVKANKTLFCRLAFVSFSSPCNQKICIMCLFCHQMQWDTYCMVWLLGQYIQTYSLFFRLWWKRLPCFLENWRIWGSGVHCMDAEPTGRMQWVTSGCRWQDCSAVPMICRHAQNKWKRIGAVSQGV